MTDGDLDPGHCQVADEGWLPQHVLVRNEATGQLVGACPMYLKSHSYGARVVAVSDLPRLVVVDVQHSG